MEGFVLNVCLVIGDSIRRKPPPVPKSKPVLTGEITENNYIACSHNHNYILK